MTEQLGRLPLAREVIVRVLELGGISAGWALIFLGLFTGYIPSPLVEEMRFHDQRSVRRETLEVLWKFQECIDRRRGLKLEDAPCFAIVEAAHPDIRESARKAADRIGLPMK